MNIIRSVKIFYPPSRHQFINFVSWWWVKNLCNFLVHDFLHLSRRCRDVRNGKNLKNKLRTNLGWVFFIVHVVMRIEELPQLPSPRPLSLDVTREEVLVRGGREREGMVLALAEGGARHPNPLSGLVLEVGRSVEGWKGGSNDGTDGRMTSLTGTWSWEVCGGLEKGIKRWNWR